MKGLSRVAIVVIATRTTMATDSKDGDALSVKLSAAGVSSVKVFRLQKARDTAFQNPAAFVAALGEFLSGAPSYGIYILMHGNTTGYPSPAAQVYSPASLGGLLSQVSQLHGDPSAFKKLNFVACNLGQHPTDQSASASKLTLLKPYAASLCEVLKNEHLMVAAYTVPVYVYWDGNPELDSSFGSPAPRIKGSPSLGQRLFQPASDLEVATRAAAENQAIGKVVWRYQGGKAVVVDLAEYHQYR